MAVSAAEEKCLDETVFATGATKVNVVVDTTEVNERQDSSS